MSHSIEVLDMIIEDMENDVKEFDRKPFTGKTVGELHGNLAAAIQALAKILRKHIKEEHLGHHASKKEGLRNE